MTSQLTYHPSSIIHISLLNAKYTIGGDGLVAARHLSLFSYDVTVLYPKPSLAFAHLVKQCHAFSIAVSSTAPVTSRHWDVVIDAMFGFSFKRGPVGENDNGIRSPFKDILQELGWWMMDDG